MEGGPGSDTVIDEDAEPGADRFDGGGGDDRLSFEGRLQDSRIDLVAQASSDGDTLAGFEHAVGGAGDDVLAGDHRANLLAGGSGQDRLTGGGGDDRLYGGGGFDAFDAGPGDDRVYARLPSGPLDRERDARPEPIACGAGRDRIEELHDDEAAPDCELVPFGTRAQPVSVRAPTSLRIVVGCTSFVRVAKRCRGSVAVAHAGTAEGGADDPPARARFSFRGTTARVRVALRGVYVPRDEPVTIVVRYANGEGGPVAVRWSIPRLPGSG